MDMNAFAVIPCLLSSKQRVLITVTPVMNCPQAFRNSRGSSSVKRPSDTDFPFDRRLHANEHPCISIREEKVVQTRRQESLFKRIRPVETFRA
jgi:hypothetical protein